VERPLSSFVDALWMRYQPSHVFPAVPTVPQSSAYSTSDNCRHSLNGFRTWCREASRFESGHPHRSSRHG
jgi:hypothetical protein